MPTKPLPANATLEHLEHQARDLFESQRNRAPATLQRIRVFHPRFASSNDENVANAHFVLADAYLTLAREHGFVSWARLRAHVQNGSKAHDVVTRIDDATFRTAVALLDDGDVEQLGNHLRQHPQLALKRVHCEGFNYFSEPALLEFIAENPIRNHSLPPNIVDIARVILDAGAKSDQRALDTTLALVCSGSVVREHGVQTGLIEILCAYGAKPDAALIAAVGHAEFDAALGNLEKARRALPAANAEQRHLALAWSAQYGHVEIVRMLLDGGEDPNRYNPEGAHSHSTPLHQAAAGGHDDVVRLLVQRGAAFDAKDTLWNGTPLGWAEHGGQDRTAQLLRTLRDSH